MSISDIVLSQTFAEVARVTKKNSHDVLPHTDVSPEALKVTGGSKVDVKAEISSYASNSLQKFNLQFNSLLKSIRIADQTMESVQAHIGQMHSEVQAFLKTYPPYPPGSEERIEKLQLIAGIRQQIERLILPQDHFAGLILGNNTGSELATDYSVKIGGQSSGEKVRTHNMHLDSQGLDIPELPLDASDQQIADAQENLEKAAKSIQTKRAALNDDIKKLIRNI
ncbi:MAG: hypothetical protein VR64_16815 [Desulfatitalea sp. BRH_c12]|nr:MAG: hypothetical protein VR64_16815 [Desulfatitalea sp. BRH_c12]